MGIPINLDTLTEDELLELNREIIRRIEMRRNIRRQSQLMAFQVGDCVAFDTDDGVVEGTIIRINQKTASINGNDGRCWRISPGLLSKVIKTTAQQTNDRPMAIDSLQ
ncbi:MAG: hypothetical protein WCG27_06115 [Pseudomonadota bacterium]